MICGRCRQRARPGATVCPKCGAPLASPARGRRAAGAHPILDAIARTAARLCEARDAQIILVEGATQRIVAQHGTLGSPRKLGEPFPLSRGTVYGRAALERRVIHVRDLKAVVRAQYPDVAALPRATRVRTMLAAPLLSEGTAVGVIAIRRLLVRPFTSRQIALLQTFADQAAIAIENARLFSDLTEALEQQTATAEILGAISRSPTDLRPVLEALVRAAARFCGAVNVALLTLDGSILRGAAVTGQFGEEFARRFGGVESIELPVSGESATGRAVVERRVVHIHDLAAEPESGFRVGRALQREFGHHTMVAAPLLREGVPIGAIDLFRTEINPFSDRQLALLQTFADQAVIAIENVRLFTELQAKNRALTLAHAQVTEALEQQTATSEILGAISTSTTDAQPVFQTIAEAAVRLCGALFGSVYRFDGALIHMVAHHNYPPAALEFSQRMFPTPPTRQVFTGRAILERGVVHVPNVAKDPERAQVQELAEVIGFRSALSVPMFREGSPIGAITLWGSTVGAFSESHIALLKTFADQAVIAMENVRLFSELEARNVDLTEGLERERATGEILRVISSSPTDIQPVLEAILDSAKRLCDAEFGAVFRFEGDAFVIAASTMVSSEFAIWLRSHPVRPGPGTPLTRAGIERRPVQVADILADPDFAPPDVYRREGMRTALAVPMLKDDVLLGALTFHRHTVQPFTDQQIALLETFAAQAVIAIENVRLFTELQARNRDLTEALERQTATSEILGVISRSPTDVQPVLDAIIENAVRLSGATYGIVWRYIDDVVHVSGVHNISSEELESLRREYPRRFEPALHTHTAVRSGVVLHIPDVEVYEHATPTERARLRMRGIRSRLVVPMRRGDTVIGAIGVSHPEVGAFSVGRVELLKTFADQAVIAIENVRLFTELEARNRDLTEALEQQTATAEILRVISTSPTNLQPVLETLAASAARFCGSYDGSIFHLDGNTLRLGAHHGPLDSHPVGLEVPVVRGAVMGRSILDREAVHVVDLQAETEEFPEGSAIARRLGFHTLLCVPLLREGAAIGAIGLRRIDVSPFTDKQITLAKTFADQAVIAIENVRLFTELQEKNRALTQAHAQVTETLEQQTATSEILRTIAHAQTDVQPVFETIVRNAVELCHVAAGWIWLLDGDWLRVTAPYNVPDDFPMGIRVMDAPNATRVIRDGMTFNVADTEDDPRITAEALKMARAMGVRANLAVPLRRDREAIGALTVYRDTPGIFPESQVELLKTFADQAVIAIENVRLFNELETRNRDLTEALEQQTATAEILRVISTSPTNLQPVLDTVVASAARFCGAYDANLLRIDGERLRLAAHQGPIPIAADFSIPLVRGTVAGRSVLERRAVQIADIQTEAEEFPEGRIYALPQGTRTLLSVPLLREGAPVGAIALRRTEVDPFTDKQIALLQTFADQAVIAIENVRLFTELGQRNRDLTQALEQQTATAEVLRVIGSSPTDTQPVFDAIANSARRLLGGFSGGVYRRVGDEVHVAAYTSTTPSGDAAIRSLYPRPLAKFSLPGEAIRTGTIIMSTDIETDPRIAEEIRNAIRVRGFRSAVWVPMLREGAAIGAIGVTRNEPGAFADEQIALLKTFADQAVIAIENVRLFKELEARNRDLTEALEQQTATAEILRVISGSPTDVQPVFDAIAKAATALCLAENAGVFLFDGRLIHFAAHYNWTERDLNALREAFPRPPGPGTVTSQAILTRAVAHTIDIASDSTYEMRGFVDEGFHAIMSVPMLRDGDPIGAISVTRREAVAFTDRQISLLKTFADQAVIAIQNVRLFKELEARNRDLTVALEQQTATSEVLRVISQSQTDVQPVFDTIVESAARLCDAVQGNLQRFDGEGMHMVAAHNMSPESWDLAQRQYPMRLDRSRAASRAVLDRAVVNIPDVLEDPEYDQVIPRVGDWSSVLSVPMFREGKAIGAITVARAAAGRFSENQVDLLKTFADQAVIALENVRLFKELQTRTVELTRSVEQLTALGEVSRAVSSTLDVETVLDTIVSRASQLAGADGAVIYEYDEGTEHFHVRSTHGFDTQFVEAIRGVPVRKGEGTPGRAAQMREPFQVADITVPGAYEGGLRNIILGAGYRSALSVPLLREEEVIGTLTLTRKTAGEFSSEIVEMLKTFATQSALAIQNARLFREIEDKGRELELASKHKSQFLANMSHELRTPLNAILGYTELLLDGIYGEVPDKARETMGRIERSGRHLLALINDVLDLSKIEAGQLTLSLADYSLSEVVNTVVTAMEPLAAEKGLALRVALDPGLPLARGDDRRLSQVLLNLVGNAVKFTDAGEVRIEGKASDGTFLVSVSDTGPGIAAEDQARIFDEFQQVDSSNTRKKGGTGLGLSIARRILALHGGRIWVESAPGQGATFSFTLPVRVERMVQTS